MNEYHKRLDLTLFAACEHRFGVHARAELIVMIMLLCAFMLSNIGGCSKSDDDEQRMRLLADAKQASERAADSSKEAEKASEDTEDNTQEAGDHLQQAKDSLHSAELEAAANAARDTISAAEHAEEFGSTVANPVETTFSEADKAKQTISTLRATFKSIENETDMLHVTEEISRKTDDAVSLAKSSSIKADKQQELAKAHKDEAQAILRLISKLAEAKSSLQQAQDAAKQAEESTQTAQELSQKAAEAAEKAQQSGNQSKALEYAAEARQLAGASGKSASQAESHAEVAGKHANHVLELTDHVSAELDSGYENSELAAYTEEIASDAKRVATSAVKVGQEAEYTARVAKENAQHLLVTFPELPNDLSENPSQPQASAQGNGAQKNVDEEIDPALIPKLPPMPVFRSKPRGALIPENTLVLQPSKTASRFRQICDNHKPDFLPGGYSGSEFRLRVDDILEVRRTFGEKGCISLTWRMSYRWNKNRTCLLIGEEPESRPPSAALVGFAVRSMNVNALPAADSMPVELAYEELPNGTVRLGGKLYRSEKAALAGN